MAKFLAQIILQGSQAVARAFNQALRQEYQATMSARKAAEESGRSGAKAAKANTFTGMNLNEAKQILNVQDLGDIEAIRKNYNHLFKMNSKSGGGSFYLQSKVVRAKERLEMELDSEIGPSTEPDNDNQTSSNSDSNSKT